MGRPPKVLPETKTKANSTKTRGQMAKEMSEDPEQQEIRDIHFHRHHNQHADADLSEYRSKGVIDVQHP